MQGKHDWNSLKHHYTEKLPNDPKLADEMFMIAMRHILLAEQLGYDLAIRQAMQAQTSHSTYLRSLLMLDCPTNTLDTSAHFC